MTLQLHRNTSFKAAVVFTGGSVTGCWPELHIQCTDMSAVWNFKYKCPTFNLYLSCWICCMSFKKKSFLSGSCLFLQRIFSSAEADKLLYCKFLTINIQLMSARNDMNKKNGVFLQDKHLVLETLFEVMPMKIVSCIFTTMTSVGARYSIPSIMMNGQTGTKGPAASTRFTQSRRDLFSLSQQVITTSFREYTQETVNLPAFIEDRLFTHVDSLLND